MFENKFESLERLRTYLLKVKGIKDKMEYWMDENEKKYINETISMIEKDIEELKEDLLDENICPYCGGDILTKTWIEETCGKVGFRYCEKCYKKWSDE